MIIPVDTREGLIKRILNTKDFDRDVMWDGYINNHNGEFENILRLENHSGQFDIKVISQKYSEELDQFLDLECNYTIEGKIKDIESIVTDEVYNEIMEKMKVVEFN